MHLTVPRRRVAVLAAGSALALATTGALTAVAAPPSPTGVHDKTTDSVSRVGRDTSRAIVRLSKAPVSRAAATRPAHGRQLNLRSGAVRNYRATLRAQRNTFKKWLHTAAPKARVTGEYDLALNAVAVRLNGTTLRKLRKGPGVTFVGYQGRYVPTAEDPDLALIRAEAAWAAANPPGGPSRAGWGVQVGIVDTGIDVTHPCFDDQGFPNTKQLGDTRFTNNKVIVARVFANKARNLGLTPEALQDHGTHVAGTVACDYRTPAVVNGADIPYDPSGVAPGAQLGNYNVFPGSIEDARSEDILNALQAAAQDGMDVINMSLGGDAHGFQDLLTHAVDNLDRANIVVAISAGNEGPGHFTAGSPGSGERALTAGASTVGHFVGIPVRSGGATLATAATSDFQPQVTQNITGTLVAATGTPLGTGCEAGSYTNATGKIALVSRGTCTFSEKVDFAEQAGAIAVIVVNNVPGDPIAMGTTEGIETSIPAVMVGLGARDAMLAKVGQSVTLVASPTYVDSGNDNIMANFSSQGPTDVSYRVKPDLVAPGVNVLSSIPQSFCDPLPAEGCWAFFQGTSMASPHLAGAAAVVRQAHPAWAAWQVRSAIVNTAQEGVLKQATSLTGALETDPQVVGAGLLDVHAAVTAKLALSQVSMSFGAIPSRNAARQTRSVSVTNLTGATLTVPVTVTGSAAFSVSPATLTIPAGGTATVTVTFRPAASPGGDTSATLRLGSLAHAVLYAFVK